MRFRKKPVVIEAFQWRSDADPSEWPQWLRDAHEKPWEAPGAFTISLKGEPFIHTLEGVHNVSDGDWIIRGVKGEIYPCKPDIFMMTYDLEV
jgi:hypothetical protein